MSMQVRTLIPLLLILALALSLLCLIYSLVQRRTVFSDSLFSPTQHAYFTLKYHTCAFQINALQFAAQLIVIATEISLLALLVLRRCAGKSNRSPSSQSGILDFLLLAFMVHWQGVVVGYSLTVQIQIGYAQGSNSGDMAMAAMQGVTFTAILIALITHAYYFTTLQPKPENSLSPAVSPLEQPEDSVLEENGTNKQEKNHRQTAIHCYKPNFEQKQSPMSRMFQNLSSGMAEMDHPVPTSARKPLLDAQESHDSSGKDSSKEEPAKKLKIAVPKLKLGEVRKRETLQDFRYPLNNLEISIISPQPRSHRSQKDQPSF